MPPSSEQKLLNSGVSKDNLSKVYLLPWSTTKEIKLCMFQFKITHNAVFTKDTLFKANIYRMTNVFTAKTKQKHVCICLLTVRIQWLFQMIWNGAAKIPILY